MATIRCEMAEVAGLIAALGPRSRSALERAATSIAMRALTVVQEATRKAPPANPKGVGSGGAVNTGYFLRAWSAIKVNRGDSIGVLVSNNSPYSGVIEFGRRPGARRPPIEALARWAQRRFSIPYAKARGMAFGMSKAIARRGLKGRFILTGPDTTGKFKKIMEHELLHELLAEMRSP